MASQSPVQSTTPCAREQEREGDGGPVILHYIPSIAARKGRRSIALCGEVFKTKGMTYTRNARKTGNTLICPMCELELERRRDSYHDPNEPVFPLAVGLGLRALMEDKAGMSVWEVAQKAGLDPRQLNLEVNTGSITTEHMDALAHACGTDAAGALSWINMAREAIELTRKKDQQQ